MIRIQTFRTHNKYSNTLLATTMLESRAAMKTVPVHSIATPVVKLTVLPLSALQEKEIVGRSVVAACVDG